MDIVTVPMINKIIGCSKRLKHLKYIFRGIIMGHFIHKYSVPVKTVSSSKNRVVSKLTLLITNIPGYKLGIC